MDHSTCSPYRPVELRWKTFKAQLRAEEKELEVEFNRERDALNERAKINHDALDVETLARQDRIRKDQDDQLKAILARHKQDIIDHNAATAEKLREAEEEALKVKKDKLARVKEAGASIELKFTKRRRQLEEKRKHAEEEVKELCFSEVDKQVAASPLVNSIQVDLDLPSSCGGTPLRPGANAPLNPPQFSPITPRNGSPALGHPQGAVTPIKTLGGLANSTPSSQQPQGTLKTLSSTAGEAQGPRSNAGSGTSPSYQVSNQEKATITVDQTQPNVLNAPSNSVPRTADKGSLRASLATPTTSTPKPPSRAFSSSAAKIPRKELVQGIDEAQDSCPRNDNTPGARQCVAPVAPFSAGPGPFPRTPATSTPKIQSEVFGSSSCGKSQNVPTSVSLSTQTGGISHANISRAAQDILPVTPVKGPGRVQVTTPVAVTPTPASRKAQNVLWSSSPAGHQDFAIEPQSALALMNFASSHGQAQGATGLSTTPLVPETPTLVAVSQESTTIRYKNGVSSATKLPQTPTRISLAVDSRSPSLSLGGKRKTDASHKGLCSVERQSEYSDGLSDSDDAFKSAKRRSAKRPKTQSSSTPKGSSPLPIGNKPGPQVKSSAKGASSGTGQQPPTRKTLARPRTVPAQGVVGEERTVAPRNTIRDRTALSSPAARKKMQGVRPQMNSASALLPGAIATAKIKQQPTTPPKAVLLSNFPPPRTATPSQFEPQSLEKHFEIDRVCYPSTEGKMFSWKKGEDQNIQYHLVLEKGRYTAYVNGQLGNREYAAWMINPKSIQMLEFCYEQRLVKITRTWNNDPEAHIFFGFTYGAEDFVRSIIESNPEVAKVKLELEDVAIRMLAR